MGHTSYLNVCLQLHCYRCDPSPNTCLKKMCIFQNVALLVQNSCFPCVYQVSAVWSSAEVKMAARTVGYATAAASDPTRRTWLITWPAPHISSTTWSVCCGSVTSFFYYDACRKQSKYNLKLANMFFYRWKLILRRWRKWRQMLKANPSFFSLWERKWSKKKAGESWRYPFFPLLHGLSCRFSAGREISLYSL